MENNYIISEIDEKSQLIVNDFLAPYGKAESYFNIIKRIQEHYRVADFSKLIFAQYNEMIDLHSDSKTNIDYINSFFKYLYSNDFLENEEGFEYTFDSKRSLLKKRRSFEKKGNKADSDIEIKGFKPYLTITEIEKLIEFSNNVEPGNDFQANRNNRMAYLFHALFFQGMSPGAAKSIDTLNLHKGKILTDEGEFEVPERFHNMFLYFQSRPKATTFNSIKGYIDELGASVGIDNLMPSTISNARGQNKLNCPECGDAYLLFSENWKSIHSKIVCTNCATKLMQNDLKKNIIYDIEEIEMEILSEKEKKQIDRATSSYEKLKRKLKIPCNFDEWNKYLEEIGELGEQFVLEQERIKLFQLGLDDLAEKVDEKPALDHTNGFDILSYSPDGTEIKIEVKSTPGNENQPFYMSKNELEIAQKAWKMGGLYEIHRVYNVGKDNIKRKIYNSMEEFELEELVYKVTIKNV